MKIFIVNAFAEGKFEGNLAGVVIETGKLNAKEKQKIAKELGYSETVFVVLDKSNSIGLSFFTPVSEIDMCGHATIAAMFVLNRELGFCQKVFKFRTNAGTVMGYVKGEIQKNFFIDMGEVQYEDVTIEQSVLNEILGITSESVNTGTVELNPVLIMAGIPDIHIELKNRRMLSDLSPDNEALIEMSNTHNVIGLHAYTVENGRVYCRNFAPLYGIDEEYATGTSNYGLLNYLNSEKKLKICDTIEIVQGSEEERIGKLYGWNHKGKILVGGTCVKLLEGRIFI